MSTDAATLRQIARRTAGRDDNFVRLMENILDRLDAAEPKIETAQETADEANGKLTRVGFTSSLDTSGTALVYDAGFDWPDSVHAADLFLVSLEMGAAVDVAQIVHGDELNDLSDGAAGNTALIGNTNGIELWQITAADTVREVAKIGKASNDSVLIDPALAGNANTVLGIYRISI